MLRLIDYEKEQPVEIDGAVFHIKPLMQGDRIRLSFLTKKLGSDLTNLTLSNEDMDVLIATLDKQVVGIEAPGYEDWPKEKILRSLSIEKDLIALIVKLQEISTISETELGN